MRFSISLLLLPLVATPIGRYIDCHFLFCLFDVCESVSLVVVPAERRRYIRKIVITHHFSSYAIRFGKQKVKFQIFVQYLRNLSCQILADAQKCWQNCVHLQFKLQH